MKYTFTASSNNTRHGRKFSHCARYFCETWWFLIMTTAILWELLHPWIYWHGTPYRLLRIQHDLLVSSIDWSPHSNKIVSCSHDRNAFVWTFESSIQTWKPTLVILRIDRAATDVKWSLDGRRFAVASSAKVVPVCMYEPVNDWWGVRIIHRTEHLTTSQRSTQAFQLFAYSTGGCRRW